MKKAIACFAGVATLALTTCPVFANPVTVTMSTTPPATNNGTTYTLTQQLTNLGGTYFYVSVNGVGIVAIDPPTVMY